MSKFLSKLILLSALISVLVLPNFFIEAAENLAEVCDIKKIEQAEKDVNSENISRDDYRVLLEKCKKYYDDEITEIEKDVDKTGTEKKNLENEVSSLQKKVKNLDYQIYQNNIIIKDLGIQVEDTEHSIGDTIIEIEESQNGLAATLREIYEEEQKSIVEILLSEEKLSKFYDNLVALEVLSNKFGEEVENVKDLKSYLENQKESLSKDEQNMKNVVVAQKYKKDESAEAKKEQEKLLKFTKQEYDKYVAEKTEVEKSAAKIGNLLFQLIDVKEGGIKFEEAVEISKSTSALAGIRTAFSLAILWQETRIGQVEGGCYLANKATGGGTYIKSGNKALRTLRPQPRSYETFSDVYYFEQIVKGLNKAGKLQTDIYHTPISCGMFKDGKPFGWGGAMGPAQFIPNTWMLFDTKIAKLTGRSPANPWDVRDAFLASSLYLKDLGAGSKTYDKEINAALRYFGCTSSWCKRNYGEPVMRAAGCFQGYIDNGSMSSNCRNFVF